MKYKLVQCPRCGNKVVTTSDKRARCHYCGRYLTVRKYLLKESDRAEQLIQQCNRIEIVRRRKRIYKTD